MTLVLTPASIAAAIAANPAILEAPPQSFTPNSGDNCVLTDNNLNGTASIEPAGALALLTITLPTEANSRIGQQRDIFIGKAVTGLTISGALTIVNNITASIANSWISVRKVGANKWTVRVS